MTYERRTVRAALTALLVPVVLALGACGGSGDDTATPTTAAGGASTPSTSAKSSGAGDADASGDFCERAKALEGKDDVGTVDAVASYQSLLEVAPDEVRPDLETMIEYFRSVPSGGSDPAAIEEFAELSQRFAEASGRAVRYVNENC
ncbi:MAG: hypothetical protein ACKO04_00275 [Actinomycetes bacterium]